MYADEVIATQECCNKKPLLVPNNELANFLLLKCVATYDGVIVEQNTNLTEVKYYPDHKPQKRGGRTCKRSILNLKIVTK